MSIAALAVEVGVDIIIGLMVEWGMKGDGERGSEDQLGEENGLGSILGSYASLVK